jgi:hypothetical protein
VSVLKTGTASVQARRVQLEDQPWNPGPADIVIGKDVLELLSTSMYVDPMTIYREYVQNAADAIDDAREQGLLALDAPGEISIVIDATARTIQIRDNGTGIAWPRFSRQLTAIGASGKRGTKARGFRGVGRLAGLGYCQEVIFRSRVSGETQVSELRWDCRKLQSALRSADFQGGLTEIIRDTVAVRRAASDGFPQRFFEVELRGVIRHRNDKLLSPAAVVDYLGQVAPLPFNPAFRFAPDIETILGRHVALGNLRLLVNGEGPIHRPHGDTFAISDDEHDAFSELDMIEVPATDGGIAAVGWLLHHGYTGAIPARAGVKGLRLRVGNIQVGDGVLLEELFPETRFNAWSVGEIHVIDSRIVPNGRRDHFQPNVHFSNLLNHLAPTAREVARRCRTSSVRRKWLREFELQHTAARQTLGILKQGTLPTPDRDKHASVARKNLAVMKKIAQMDDVDPEGQSALKPTVERLEKDINAALGAKAQATALARLTPAKRRLYEHMFALIYECSTNHVAAKALIDRILRKID